MLRVALVVVGAYDCLLGAVVHRQVWVAGGVTWPWGLVATVVVTALVTVAANDATRVGGAWLAIGWAGALLALQWSPGGSYLVASDGLGMAFTAGSLGVIVLAVAARTRLGPRS
ncbi:MULTISPECIES: hypothetical protein [Aeromicrobium]|uniref:hypothetical protein n=1 Tax=Aeromicrobium TaxID=2040 RepID=UPI0006F52AF9|nr:MULTISPECIES: hypothetical protein [Aeromicrobium]KQX72422.1 hypothetical protein ASD10_15640 [Aeromicrobium sp. Root472D3]MCL8251754.1 hypothetical protein [Aeromicrobium fastidiosum]